MSTYTFHYFDVRGRGELSRYVLHAAGQKFEDKRYTGEEWVAFKNSCPFGQMPVLDVDGKRLAQSGAIARFLARELNLMGKTKMDQAECDQYMGLMDDMFDEVVKAYFEKDEAKKAELTKKLNEEGFPKYMGMFEKGLDKNGGKYMVGDKLTVADLAIYGGFDTPLKENEKMMDKFPKLKAHRAMVEAVPALAKYLKDRKPTDI